MSTVAITQPTYLPWLGYFQQMARADVFVFLDTVQFAHQSWQSRNRIRDHEGNTLWLAVPVASHHLDDRIYDICIADQPDNWRRKHLNSVRTHLGGTPHMASVMEVLESTLDKNHEYLADLNTDLIERVRQKLGIETRLIRASELKARGSRADLLLTICRELDCNRFLANAGSRCYLQTEEQRFEQAGITIKYQAWEHPQYPQRGQGFIPNLSWVDPVCHLGWEREALGLPEGGGRRAEVGSR